MQRLAIYLAGNIQKSHSTYDDSYWTDKELSQIQQMLAPTNIDFLNPSERMDDLSDQKSVFGRDMSQVFSADIIFVDARERRGLGVGAEMMWAKMNRKPVITWAPEGSYYNSKNVFILDKPVAHFIHPFIENLSDAIVSTVDEGAEWIKNNIILHKTPIRGIEYLQETMLYYREHYLQKDEPMQKIIKANSSVRENLAVDKV